MASNPTRQETRQKLHPHKVKGRQRERSRVCNVMCAMDLFVRPSFPTVRIVQTKEFSHVPTHVRHVPMCGYASKPKSINLAGRGPRLEVGPSESGVLLVTRHGTFPDSPHGCFPPSFARPTLVGPSLGYTIRIGLRTCTFLRRLIRPLPYPLFPSRVLAPNRASDSAESFTSERREEIRGGSGFTSAVPRR
ncbi:hypothetical protein H6P81_004278 [Aristolochia fimbriata]|uniref:Uncharacterized protein n=1 Tax=Aristolochia fimbriata TaxID=158543 RepID=A0AAV7FEY3_ARIFI|nr:hypothetical protein H6P81_004278 [Aristolochia fimbriata]